MKKPTESDLVAEAVAYMRLHFARPLKLTKVARHVGCSPAYLSRKFQAERSCTFTYCLNQIRVEQSKPLLLNPALTARAVLLASWPALMTTPCTPFDAVTSATPLMTGEASTMQLLRTAEPPDAFVTTSDVYAAAVIRAARQVGLRVPQDVMVTGFDNIEFSTVTTPSITTVDQPRIRMGLMACELLVEKISNPALPSKGVLLETELIVRESTSDSRSAPVITEEFFRHPF